MAICCLPSAYSRMFASSVVPLYLSLCPLTYTAATPEVESVASMQITSPLTPALTVGGVLSKQEIASLFACTLPARSVMDTWIVAFSRSSTA